MAKDCFDQQPHNQEALIETTTMKYLQVAIGIFGKPSSFQKSISDVV